MFLFMAIAENIFYKNTEYSVLFKLKDIICLFISKLKQLKPSYSVCFLIQVWNLQKNLKNSTQIPQTVFSECFSEF